MRDAIKRSASAGVAICHDISPVAGPDEDVGSSFAASRRLLALAQTQMVSPLQIARQATDASVKRQRAVMS